MVHVRSAVVGASATVAVAVGVFFAVSAGNAAEQTVPSTPNPSVVIESPEPTAVSSPTVMPEPVVTPAVEPAPVPVEETVAPKPETVVAPEPAPAAPLVQGTAPPAGSGTYVVPPGTVMPPAPEGVFYVPPDPPDPPLS